MTDDVGIDRLVPLLSALRDTLEDERAALIARNLDDITSTSDRKNALATELAQLQSELERRGIDPTGTSSNRDPVHDSVRTLLAACHEQNLVNGRIVRRSQQFVRELARILTGHEAEPLYDARGIERVSPQGTSITEA
jgi:flagellar biosynthesis/type III secretory pathway chaperone